jgi:hypothetical protein
MKTGPSLSLQILGAVLAGGLAGTWLAHPVPGKTDISSDGIPISPSTYEAEASTLRTSPPTPLIHADLELDDWVRQAGELAAMGGLGFHAETDAPHLLLAAANLTPGDFPLLMERLARLSDGPAKRQLEEWLLAEWSRQAPETALAWTRENRPDRYGEAVIAFARKDARAAWQDMQGYLEKTKGTGDLTHAVFFQWGLQNRHEALEALLQRMAKVEEYRAVEGFLTAVLPDRKKFPEQWRVIRDEVTARMAQEENAGARLVSLRALMTHMKMDSQISWDDTASLEPTRNELSRWLMAIPLSEVEQGKLLISIAQWDGLMPGAAQDSFSWLWRTVPEGQRVSALTSIVENWASENPWSSNDPDACGKWLNEQGPLGTEFSGALKSFALHAAAKDPESGLAWAQQIADPAIRQDAVQQVKAQILKQWPHRAAGLGVGP